MGRLRTMGTPSMTRAMHVQTKVSCEARRRNLRRKAGFVLYVSPSLGFLVVITPTTQTHATTKCTWTDRIAAGRRGEVGKNRWPKVRWEEDGEGWCIRSRADVRWLLRRYLEDQGMAEAAEADLEEP